MIKLAAENQWSVETSLWLDELESTGATVQCSDSYMSCVMITQNVPGAGRNHARLHSLTQRGRKNRTPSDALQTGTGKL